MVRHSVRTLGCIIYFRFGRGLRGSTKIAVVRPRQNSL